MALLSAGKVKSHYAFVLEFDCQLRHLERVFRRELSQAANNESRCDSEIFLRPAEPAEGRFDRLDQRDSLHDVQDRSIANLDVAHAIFGGVLCQLVGNALERVPALHDGNGHVEAAKVVLERARVIHSHEFRQLLGSVFRELNPMLARQLHEGCRAY